MLYIHRLLSTSITEQAKQQEWNIIRTIAKNNGSPIQLIYNLRNKINKNNTQPTFPHKQHVKMDNIHIS